MIMKLKTTSACAQLYRCHLNKLQYLDAVLEADINKYRPKLPSLQSMMEAQMLAPLGLSRSSDSVKVR